MINQFVRALLAGKINVDAIAIADILWLFSELDKESDKTKVSAEKIADNGEQLANVPSSKSEQNNLQNKDTHDAEHKESEKGSNRSEKQKENRQESVTEVDSGEVGVYSKIVREEPERIRLASLVNLPAPDYLPNALELARAFRPLMTRYQLASATQFDPDATVHNYAETLLLQPEFKHDQERWFDVSLVIDSSSSMAVWSQTIKEYFKLVSRQGAFRDVRRWQLKIKDDKITIVSESGLIHDTRDLIDWASRRLIMIVTDCVAKHWYQDNIWQIIRSWAVNTPVVLVQLLSDSYWQYTALGGVETSIFSLQPGLSNDKLESIPPWWAYKPNKNQIAIPVINLEYSSTIDWANMLMGGSSFAQGILLDTNKQKLKQYKPPDPNLSPEQRINTFRIIASSEAYELATYLAVVPLSLPIISLVQRAMMPSSTQMHLAEIFIGGIIYRVTADTLEARPEEIEYDYHLGVRERLQSELSRLDVLRILHTVAHYIESTMGVPFQFSALVADPNGLQKLPSGALPFAKMGTDVLSRLGFNSQTRVKIVTRGQGNIPTVPDLEVEKDLGKKQEQRSSDKNRNYFVSEKLDPSISVQTLSTDNITKDTPLGARPLPSGNGVTVSVWAPGARAVYVLWCFVKDVDNRWIYKNVGLLNTDNSGNWNGYISDLSSGDRYMFYVVGPEDGTEGPKRDPYALALSEDPPWPECHCILYDSSSFSWHDQSWRPHSINDLIIYQLHIGTWYIPSGRLQGTFLDVVERLSYLNSLGVNAIQLLPIAEFPTKFSLGYNGVDIFSPELDYSVKSDDPALKDYLFRINSTLSSIDPSNPPYTLQNIQGAANQFRILVDMCHLFGISVILDVVYSHAGGDFGDRSAYFFDRQPYGNQNNSLYFTDQGWAGGLVYAYWKQEVRQYLVDNAKYYLLDCHCDGLRYDEISVVLQSPQGQYFCQNLTTECRNVKPEAIHIAEHWPMEEYIVQPTSEGGMGFDAIEDDSLNEVVRAIVELVSVNQTTAVDFDKIAEVLASPLTANYGNEVRCLENQDIVYKTRDARIAALADMGNHASGYAASRSRVALGLLATAVGIPKIFMGQEILEDKQWDDQPGGEYSIAWELLESSTLHSDYLRFTGDLFRLRRQLPALRSARINTFHIHNDNRVMSFHRWVEGEGKDVVVVCSFNESPFQRYDLGFPHGGLWREIFNSDLYQYRTNPDAKSNTGVVIADGVAMHGFANSASIFIPANSIMIFEKTDASAKN